MNPCKSGFYPKRSFRVVNSRIQSIIGLCMQLIALYFVRFDFQVNYWVCEGIKVICRMKINHFVYLDSNLVTMILKIYFLNTHTCSL